MAPRANEGSNLKPEPGLSQTLGQGQHQRFPVAPPSLTSPSQLAQSRTSALGAPLVAAGLSGGPAIGCPCRGAGLTRASVMTSGGVGATSCCWCPECRGVGWESSGARGRKCPLLLRPLPWVSQDSGSEEGSAGAGVVGLQPSL